MKQDVILAGVGGQGILTIAQAISAAAVGRGLHVKQADVHDTARPGGGVRFHLRISDGEIHGDRIPAGAADLVIAFEPLQALQCVRSLREQGAAVVSQNVLPDVPSYPPVETVLDRVAELPRHVLVDADRLARAAGSGRAAAITVLGAASPFLELAPDELEESVAAMFAARGEPVVAVERRAFRFGRGGALAYLDGLAKGGASSTVRHWIDTLEPEQLARPEPPAAPVFAAMAVEHRLSGAEAHAVERSLEAIYREGRRQLFEHEIYNIVQLVGAIAPPHHVFVSTADMISADDLEPFPGDRVALKIVAPDIVHKTEAQGISFVRKSYETVRAEIDRLIERHRASADVRGVLAVEHVERVRPALGNELFVGIRTSREFGPVIAAGLGGIDTEYLADKMLPGSAVAKAAAMETSAEEFLVLFKRTAAYELLSGRARGRSRIVSDGELLRCFAAFIHLARRFCVDRGEAGPDVAELEVNPFAFRQQRLVPLDGRGRLAPAARALPPRSSDKVERMLEPRSIAVLGVSSTALNPGRIILRNVVRCGFPKEHTYVVKENARDVDGVRCVPTIRAVPETIDLLVIAAEAGQLPAIIDDAVASGNVQSAIMIPGGVGETEGSEPIATEVRDAIAKARSAAGGGPVFVGPNSLGAISKPGCYDTLFIPSNRLDKRWSAPARRVALVSQSGAFIVSRMSNLESLDPAFAISLGNQLHVTPSDVVAALGKRDDVDVIGVYAEGFNDLDGLELLRNISAATRAGKVVVFYKAGRTAPGRSAAAGHTASVAGDYDVCQAAAGQAGALVADTFKEFEQLLEIGTALHSKRVSGVRLGVISNAGFETVGMADAIRGQRYAVEIAELSGASTAKLRQVLERHGLSRLVNARCPLDITPMASEEVYEEVIDVMLDSGDVDAVVVGVVPLTAALGTGPDEIGATGSLANRIPSLVAAARKPLVVVVDSGALYEPLVRALRLAGVPVFPSADQAIRSLGRYLCHRVDRATLRQPATAAASAPWPPRSARP